MVYSFESSRFVWNERCNDAQSNNKSCEIPIKPYRFLEPTFMNTKQMAKQAKNYFMIHNNNTTNKHTISTQRNVVVKELYDRTIETLRNSKQYKYWCILVFQIFMLFFSRLYRISENNTIILLILMYRVHIFNKQIFSEKTNNLKCIPGHN